MALPDALVSNITTLHGEIGREWLHSLPERLAQLGEAWELEIGEPYAALSYHYVCRATRKADGLPVVLKLGIPGDEESLPMETAALRVYNGRGIARLLYDDLEMGAALLERVRPGTPLSESVVDAASDERATQILASVMRRLWRPLNDTGDRAALTPLSKWTSAFDTLRAAYREGHDPFPRPLFEQADALYIDLMTSAPSVPYLLHGDLHHDNILTSTESRGDSEPYLAIDPKGLAGDPAFDIAAMLSNPIGRFWDLPDTRRILHRRLDILSTELDMDRARLRDWGIAQSVLSAWWSFADGLDDYEGAIRIAEILAEQK